MNSCRSRLLLACAPPLMTFIIGTGICIAPHAAEVAVQRQARFFGRGACATAMRHGQHRVGAEAALVVGAVEVDQRAVEEGLLARVEAEHRFGDLGVDVLDRLAARPCRGSGSCRRRAARSLRASRWRRRTARRRGPWCRIRAARRIRRWDCRGCRGFRGRRCRRWRSLSVLRSCFDPCRGCDRDRSALDAFDDDHVEVLGCAGARFARLRVFRRVVERAAPSRRSGTCSSTIRCGLPVAFEHLDACRRARRPRRRAPASRR